LPVTPMMGPTKSIWRKAVVASSPSMTGMEESMKMMEMLVEEEESVTVLE
jgi:hypothetical protein